MRIEGLVSEVSYKWISIVSSSTSERKRKQEGLIKNEVELFNIVIR